MFVLFHDNAAPASPQTISCYAKNILIKAGIKGYTVRSMRSASVCGALLAGIPLHRILSQAGWIGNSSFLCEKLHETTIPGTVRFNKWSQDRDGQLSAGENKEGQKGSPS